MHPFLVVLLAAASFDSSATRADSVRASVRDTTREARRFPPVEVSAGRVHDMRSSATVHTVSADALRDLPVTSLTQALALQPGVVAVGEDLHVRGGRGGAGIEGGGGEQHGKERVQRCEPSCRATPGA